MRSHYPGASPPPNPPSPSPVLSRSVRIIIDYWAQEIWYMMRILPFPSLSLRFLGWEFIRLSSPSSEPCPLRHPNRPLRLADGNLEPSQLALFASLTLDLIVRPVVDLSPPLAFVVPSRSGFPPKASARDRRLSLDRCVPHSFPLFWNSSFCETVASGCPYPSGAEFCWI